MEAARLALAVLALLVLLLFVVPRGAAFWQARRYSVSRAEDVPSTVDGEHYRVHLTHRDPAAAADRLAALHTRAVALMKHLRRKYLANGKAATAAPGTRAHVALRLLGRYDRDQLAESSPKNPYGDTSFTLWKGRLLALCLREKDPARSGDPAAHDMHDITTLWFVTVHELAHMGVDGVGHHPEFWSAFKLLLAECVEGGVAPAAGWPDYASRPAPYCGLTIDYNPLYDPQTPLPPA